MAATPGIELYENACALCHCDATACTAGLVTATRGSDIVNLWCLACWPLVEAAVVKDAREEKRKGVKNVGICVYKKLPQ